MGLEARGSVGVVLLQGGAFSGGRRFRGGVVFWSGSFSPTWGGSAASFARGARRGVPRV